MHTLIDYCKSHNRIYCYGAGRYGRELCVFLSEQGIKLDGFVVTNRDPGVERVLEVKVYEPDEIESTGDNGWIAAVGDRFSEEIVSMLRERGVKDAFFMNDALLEDIERESHYDRTYPNNQYVNILLYHRIANSEDDFWNLCVSPVHFEEQIRWITEHYPVYRFADDFGTIREPAVVVTFDDGYRDNLEHALPILEKYNVPATFFISTGSIGGGYWWDRLYAGMNGEDKEAILEKRNMLRKMEEKKRNEWLAKYPEVDLAMNLHELQCLAAHPLTDIGAHTVSHPSLSDLSEDAQRYEIRDSVQILEEIAGHEITSFSYPMGYYNNTTLSILENRGIKKSATVRGGLSGTGNPLLLPRNVVRNQTIDDFAKFIKRCFCVHAEVRQ